jgi:small-conductance mechanosensitive channel
MPQTNITNEMINGGNQAIQFDTDSLIKIAIVLAIVIIASRLLRLYMNKMAEKIVKKRIIIKNLIPLSNLLLYLGASLFIVFGVLRVSSDLLLTLGVSAGVAIGFATQNLLANIFSGLVIIFTRPFNIGDKIEVGNYYGEVIDISLLRIQLQTPDDSTINIPSKLFLEQSLSNSNGGALDCQVVTEMYFPGNSDMDRIRQIAWEAVLCSPYTFLKKPVNILFKDEIKYYSVIKMKVKSYVYDHRYEFTYSSDLMQRIKKKIQNEKLIPDGFYLNYSSANQKFPE